MMKLALSWLLIGLCSVSLWAEIMPSPPAGYFNDYAAVIQPQVAADLNSRMRDFERQSSTQILVAIFPKMESDSAVRDYCQRLAESWKIGRKEKSNGVALFVFIQNRTLDIEVGYGLEGVLPDALAKRIIEDVIKPQFRKGNYTAGMNAGVGALMQAVRGEYKGTGRTVQDDSARTRHKGSVLLIFAFSIVIIGISALFANRARSGTVYRKSGPGSSWDGLGGGGLGGGGFGGFGGFGGGSGGGGGSFGGGGGGFSGGGGSFGGGGASGSW